jgi:hypothetical protein
LQEKGAYVGEASWVWGIVSELGKTQQSTIYVEFPFN